MSIYKLSGRLQHYVWGGESYIPSLLGIEKENEYYAEYWLGAHCAFPSTLIKKDKIYSLTDFLEENPEVLGEQSVLKFGKELPYLLKILDVKKPLSIQLHPTKAQAELGFEYENKQGIPLNAPERTYKDNNHKPEMMIALSDFWLLHGLKPKQQIIDTLMQRKSLAKLGQKLEKMDLSTFYAEVMQADQLQLSEWFLPIIQENQDKYQHNQLVLTDPDYWALYTIQAMDISLEKLDVGLICFYLFNIVNLKKGEGIFQDAGIPHAYLRGQNIELMACSDNVIRGGLTPKYVDIPTLLSTINTQEIQPQIIPILDITQRQFTYQTKAEDFALTNILYEQNESHKHTAKSAEILLVMEGKITLSSLLNDTVIELRQGESVFIVNNEIYEIKGIEKGYCVISALP